MRYLCIILQNVSSCSTKFLPPVEGKVQYKREVKAFGITKKREYSADKTVEKRRK